jgi:hypothetical protein
MQGGLAAHARERRERGCDFTVKKTKNGKKKQWSLLTGEDPCWSRGGIHRLTVNQRSDR